MPPEGAGSLHHCVADVLELLVEGCDVATDPAGVKELGVELADVLEELCVLDVPPLTVGWTLMAGWMVIIGCTLITAAATADAVFLPCAR
jgi:hypothetical protein